MKENSLYWIWFQQMFGVGSRRAELLMDYFQHPKEIYQGIQAQNRVAGMLTPEELEGAEPSLAKAEEILRRTLAKGCQVLTPDHPDYPPLLRLIYGRPAALYLKGELTCLAEGNLAIAMVGTRTRTEYGRLTAGQLARELAQNGVTVVSGLAAGIDADCHRAALEAGGKTIGVLGCGIDVDYPKANRALKTAMSRSGAVVTEFPLGAKPYPGNFPLRNRIISGMAQGTVVVEADLKSGSLITARLAREQGRDVFAVPGSIFEESGRGVHQLLKEGARLVEGAADIFAAYPQVSRKRLPERPRPAAPVPDSPVKPARMAREARPRPLPEGISPQAAKVYGAFDQDTLTVDDITAASGLEVGDVLSALTELEIYGVLEGLPGRRFGLAFQ